MLEGMNSADNNSCIRALHGDREGESHPLGEDDPHHALIIESLIGLPRLQDHRRLITCKSTTSTGGNPWARALHDPAATAPGECDCEDEEEHVHCTDEPSGHYLGDCEDYFNTS